jgi:MFS transporter, MHS family, citrate/tricarballylate:H+ symporter
MTGSVASPLKRHVAAVVIGNALEFYDFTTYAYFATQIGHTFFPSESPFVSLMGSLAAFGIGFAARPVGAIVFGSYGDRVGRKPAMLACFALMGVAILLLALTPSYAAIGIAAPIVVVIARLLQGLAVGGDVGPTTAFLLEAAPENRRGFYTALQYSSQGVSTVLGGIVGVTLSSVLDAQALNDYGWRIAFLLGAIILPIGFVIRRALPETLHAVEMGRGVATNAVRPWRTIVLGFFVLGGGTVGFYVLAYLTTYASTVLHMKANISFAATVAFGLASMIFSTLAGILSDKFGRWPVMVIPRVLFVLAIWPAFVLMVQNRDVVTLLVAAFVLGALGQMGVAGFIALTEALPKTMRSATLATVYALAISLFGGTTQLNVTWLLHTTGNPMAPAWYLLVAAIVNLIAMALMPETAPVILREREWTSGKALGQELV